MVTVPFLVPDVYLDLDQINDYLDIVHGLGKHQGEIALVFKLRDGSDIRGASFPGTQMRALTTLWLPSGIEAFPPFDEVSERLLLAHWNTYITPIRYMSGSQHRRVHNAQWVAGTWADLDIKPDQEGGFSTAEELDAFTKTLLEPTMVIDTGSGGRHPYWLLNESLTDMTKARALLSDSWRSYVWMKSHEVGRKVDLGVFDLARMLRLPGTVRHPKKAKYEPIGHTTQVHIIKKDGPRYSIDDLFNETRKARLELAKLEREVKQRRKEDHKNRITRMGTRGLQSGIYENVRHTFDHLQDWAPMLLATGWTLDADQRDHYGSTQARYWVRPGKSVGGSAMTDHGDSRIMWVWSDDPSLDDLFLGPRNGVDHVVSKYRYALIRLYQGNEPRLVKDIMSGEGQLSL